MQCPTENEQTMITKNREKPKDWETWIVHKKGVNPVVQIKGEWVRNYDNKSIVVLIWDIFRYD